jgi:hypothetical protein
MNASKIYFVTLSLLFACIFARAAEPATDPKDPIANDPNEQRAGDDFVANELSPFQKSLFYNDKTPKDLEWGKESSGIRVALKLAEAKSMDAGIAPDATRIDVYIENTSNRWTYVGEFNDNFGIRYFTLGSNKEPIEIETNAKALTGVVITTHAGFYPLPANKTYKYSVLVPRNVIALAKNSLIAGKDVSRAKGQPYETLFSNEINPSH